MNSNLGNFPQPGKGTFLAALRLIRQKEFFIFGVMNKALLSNLLLLMLLPALSGESQHISAYFEKARFFSPSNGPYVETYFSIGGHTIAYDTLDNGGLQPKVQVTIVIRKNDSVIDADKTTLNGPVVRDSQLVDLVHQRRFALPEGRYTIDASVQDLNRDSSQASKLSEPLHITGPGDSLAFSDIEFVQSFEKTDTPSRLSKSGYELVPLVSHYFPPSLDQLTFYEEVYNADKRFGEGKRYALRAFIRNKNKKEPIAGLTKLKVTEAAPVNVFFHRFNINDLPSGNYFLIVEVRDENNQLVDKNIRFFQRNKPEEELSLEDLTAKDIENTFVQQYKDPDTLQEYIHCALFPGVRNR